MSIICSKPHKLKAVKQASSQSNQIYNNMRIRNFSQNVNKSENSLIVTCIVHIMYIHINFFKQILNKFSLISK